MNMIVAYDIADPRRLYKIAKIMEDYGYRVQKSIFEVDIDEIQFRQMKARVEEVLEPKEDGVKYFSLCRRCAGTLIALGVSKVIPEEVDFLIV